MSADETRSPDDTTAPLERALLAQLEAAVGDGALAVQAQRDEDGHVAVFRFYELADDVTDAARQLSVAFARSRLSEGTGTTVDAESAASSEVALEDVKVGDEVGLEIEPLARLAERARQSLQSDGLAVGAPHDVDKAALDAALASLALLEPTALWRAIETLGTELLIGDGRSLVGEPRTGRTIELSVSQIVFAPTAQVLGKAIVRARVLVRHGDVLMTTREEEVLEDTDDVRFFRGRVDEQRLFVAAEQVRETLRGRLTELAGTSIEAPTPRDVFAGVAALRTMLNAVESPD